MPIHFNDLDVVSEAAGLKSALIVPCTTSLEREFPADAGTHRARIPGLPVRPPADA